MGTANYDTTLKRGISLKNNLPMAPKQRNTQILQIETKSSYCHPDAPAPLPIRQSRRSAADETAVWLRRACSRARERKCESQRRISAGSKSHQSLRSIHHFVSSQTKNRLDGDGRIFSVHGREISVAGGRCVPGRSRSCRSQNHPDRNRATGKTDAWSVFFLRAGFAMARDRCLKAHRFGPAHQRSRTLPALRFCPALSLAAIASIRLNAGCRFGARPFWIAFGNPISHSPDLERSQARERIESELASSFKNLYAELQQTFRLKEDDLPHSPRERMSQSVCHPSGAEGPRYKTLGYHRGILRLRFTPLGMTGSSV